MIHRDESGTAQVISHDGEDVEHSVAHELEYTIPVSQATERDDSCSGEAIKGKIIAFCSIPRGKAEIARYCGYKDLKHFTSEFLKPLLDEKILTMTIPEKPRSSRQKYVAAKRECTN